MIKQRIKEFAIRAENWLRGKPDQFLKTAKGIIHVGGNLGQEREIYDKFGLNVLWIEPIPEIFGRLRELIAPYPKQKALCHLISDVDDREYVLHVSNNDGASSSIFDLADHRQIWPDVSFAKNILVNSVKLSTLVQREKINLADYDTLVMDTQGSELLALKGALAILPHFRFIKTEVADFESYKGCCRLPDMDQFLRSQGFGLVAKHRFAHKSGVGSYFDVLYAARTKLCKRIALHVVATR